MAKRLGGRMLLRIEDIDAERAREHFVEQILDDLRWLGVEWEEPVLRQSQHTARYQEAAAHLRRLGLLYPCFATRGEIAEAAAQRGLGSDPDGSPIYPHLHKGLPAAEINRRVEAGETYAMRIDMDRALALAGNRGGLPLTFREIDDEFRETIVEADPRRWGDAVIQRKGAATSYHLCVVVDDAWQGISHVCRGRDLLAATDLHRLLQCLLGLPEPIYHHHRLVTDPTGRKLSKSAGDSSIRNLRAQGATPEDVYRLIGWRS
jgi:glutamyl-Q tRNA(Asp) synthetase